MDETPENQQAEIAHPVVEPVRVMTPSPLGALGIELIGDIVTGVVIVPKGRQRKQFKPFAELKRSERSESLDEILGRFSEFLAGVRTRLEVEYDLVLTGLRGFEKRVLRETAKIPYGRTRTYQQIATAAGKPTAYRQVLAILQANPLPLVVPCHRVVTAKSGPGSYVAGATKKKWLLRLEQRGLAV
jgi:O-6-methylguanine DNA methyltransferase